jgi:hypothetical protein
LAGGSAETVKPDTDKRLIFGACYNTSHTSLPFYIGPSPTACRTLCRHAELGPEPATVRHGCQTARNRPLFSIPTVSIEGLPKSLTQILEVVYEMNVNGYSRIQATNRVAKKRDTAPQTITDKYCRQLGKRAHEIDELLAEPGYYRFKALLTSRFAGHCDIIDMYFDSMMSEAENATFLESEIQQTELARGG